MAENVFGKRERAFRGTEGGLNDELDKMDLFRVGQLDGPHGKHWRWVNNSIISHRRAYLRHNRHHPCYGLHCCNGMGGKKRKGGLKDEMAQR